MRRERQVDDRFVAAIATGLWTWSWKWFWLMLVACGALTMLIQAFLYLFG